MKHALDVSQGCYLPEVRGALSGTTADKYGIEKFIKGLRVNQRFTSAFRIAYDSLVGPRAASADEAAGLAGNVVVSAEQAAQLLVDEEIQTEKKVLDSKGTLVSGFRRECEQFCARELEARLVLLIADGKHADLRASVTTTRLLPELE